MQWSTPGVTFPGGEQQPALGLGTWRMGEARGRRADEAAAIRAAIEIGYRLIDTAEMYGEGGAEEVVGTAVDEALRGSLARESLFIVSKVYPHNADARSMALACERSRRRLRLDQIDLYLLHWRGSIALEETVAGFEALQRRGWIRHWGVSNFDVDDLNELDAVAGGNACSADQVYYSLSQRGVEFALMPRLADRGIPLMAYSPIDRGALAGSTALRDIARRRGATAAQVALAWVLRRPGVIAIPKAVRTPHLRENWAAAAITLDTDELALLDQAFPPPKRKPPLAMT
jgi:diketogulonate reductase-like aldo/keto reductase